MYKAYDDLVDLKNHKRPFRYSFQFEEKAFFRKEVEVITHIIMFRE